MNLSCHPQGMFMRCVEYMPRRVEHALTTDVDMPHAQQSCSCRMIQCPRGHALLVHMARGELGPSMRCDALRSWTSLALSDVPAGTCLALSDVPAGSVRVRCTKLDTVGSGKLEICK